VTLSIVRFTYWIDLVNLLSKPTRSPCTQETCARSTCPHKLGACWSPALWAGGNSLLAFDIDNASDDQIDEIRDGISDLQYLSHSTHSDSADKRCLRFVFPLSRAVFPSEWSIFWRASQLRFVPIADPTCSDMNRVYFLPSCPSDASYFVQVNEGSLLDVDAVMATAVSDTLAKCLGWPKCGAEGASSQALPIAKDLRPTWEIVMEHVAQLPDCTVDLINLVLTDIRARDAVGRTRYGTPLTPGNGRDNLIDAYQECLDASVYLANELVEQGVGLNGRELDEQDLKDAGLGVGGSAVKIDWGRWRKRKYLFDVWRLYSSQLRSTIHLRSMIEGRKLAALEGVP